MKRRDVIKLGAVAAGAGIGAPGCTLPRMLGSLRGSDGGAAFNAMLDEQLGHLQKPGFLQRLVVEHTKKPLSAEASSKIAEKDEQFRRLLGTLLVSQGFRELPQETQLEPAVQERMWRHMDDIGGSVFEVSDMLASLDRDQRQHVKKALRETPDLPMMLAETLDVRAARVGMSGKRRMQLRTMMMQSSFRLRHGDPSSIVDEYVGKVERLRASNVVDARLLALTEQFNEREFWRRQHMLANDPGQPSGLPPTATPPAPSSVPPAAPSAPAPSPATPSPADQAPAPAVPGPPSATPPQAKVPMAELLTKNARSAARQGQCSTVKILGKRVRELDPEYFEAAFRNDPVIVACEQVAAERARQPPTPDPAPARPPAAWEEPEEEKPARPGTKGLRVGAYMLGIGLLSGLFGALLISMEVFAGVIGLTVAVILMGLGLLVLLISALIYAAGE